MKKRISAILLAVLLCVFFCVPSFAENTDFITDETGISADTESENIAGADNTIILDTRTRVVDMAELLDDSEESALLSKLDEISERQQLDVVVVTADTLDGKTPMEYADDFYDYNGYGFGADKDGILLLVSMEERDWWISTTGYGITAFTDAGIDYISEQFLSKLSSGDYAGAFTSFADQCDDFITQAKTGEPYDTGNLPKGEFPLLSYILISLVVGLVFALIVTNIMKGKLKTVKMQTAAADYVRSGSLNITNSNDVFLYSHVNRRERVVESSSDSSGSTTHTSSSGTSHGGGGGKF
ncbi:MAG: TPM domain-containing protein [Acutalibacteraceae bacterium]